MNSTLNSADKLQISILFQFCRCWLTVTNGNQIWSEENYRWRFSICSVLGNFWFYQLEPARAEEMKCWWEIFWIWNDSTTSWKWSWNWFEVYTCAFPMLHRQHRMFSKTQTVDLILLGGNGETMWDVKKWKKKLSCCWWSDSRRVEKHGKLFWIWIMLLTSIWNGSSQQQTESKAFEMQWRISIWNCFTVQIRKFKNAFYHFTKLKKIVSCSTRALNHSSNFHSLDSLL